jgi:hypothetical protein
MGYVRNRRALRWPARHAAQLVLPIVAALSSLAVAAASAAVPWNAVSVNQCCATTEGNVVELEAGELRWSGFAAKNTGLNIWQSTGSTKVHLGTAEPRDRSSVLFNPGPGDGAWISANRPGGLSNAPVNPGDTGVFRFRVLAPSVPRDYKEYFEPVADGAENGWLGSRIADGCYPDRWCGVHLIYRVRPQAPPALSIVEAPEVVAGPSAFRLVVDAGDNVGLARVVAVVDGDPAASQSVLWPAPDANIVDHTRFGLTGQLARKERLRFSFSPAGCAWPRGDHTVKVVAYDWLGQVDQVTRTFSIEPDPDCDGVSGSQDRCPTLPRRSTADADGCPPPSGRAARSSFLLASPGTGELGKLNKVAAAGVRGALAGAQVKAFCRPACGKAMRWRVRKDTRLFKIRGLIGKVIPDDTTIVVRVTLPRSANVYGRQWKWLVRDGARNTGGQCIEPGFAGRSGCG